MVNFLSFSKLYLLTAIITIIVFQGKTVIAQQIGPGDIDDYKVDLLKNSRNRINNGIDYEIHRQFDVNKSNQVQNQFQKNVLKSVSVESAASINDSLILVSLYNSTDGANWKNNTNWLTGPLSTWFGITVETDSVTRIQLKDNNLVGTIPAELGQLAKLELLVLDTNKLSGTIPIELGQLKNLQSLYLNGNQLSGSIPDELGQLSKLTLLFLNDNKLTGTIPVELSQLTNLRYLYLRKNQLSGAIPVELAQLSNMVFFDLSQNRLTGTIPPGLSQIAGIKWLLLNDNKLTGSIPVELGQLTNVTLLYLNGNQLSGTIPTQLSQLSQLIYLDLGMNKLEGTIPLELVQLSRLQKLDLGQNQLTGTIPAGLGQMDSLRWLLLDGNLLTGNIPVELSQIPNLNLLYLNSNQLSGTIPSGLGQLDKLEWLSLGQNKLTGTIPVELGQLSNLLQLYLDGNQLTGQIPAEIGLISRLKWLSLSQNKLTGSIPTEIFQFDSLSLLYVNDNQLTGTIPDEFGQLTNVEWVSFSKNQLNGALTSDLSKMIRLKYLDFWSNQLDSLPDLITPDSLTYLSVSQNNLSFEDLEYNMDLKQKMGFIYAPQDSIGVNQSFTKHKGEPLVNASSAGGTQNSYQWFKNGEIVSAQISDTLRFNSLKRGDSGKYYCKITNSIVSGLTLYSRVFDLTVIDTTEIRVTLHFNSGWNIFSCPVVPDSMDLLAIFKPLIDNNALIKIQDELGNPVENWKLFGGWQNFIGNINPSEGYRIKLNFADSLVIYGKSVSYPYEIPLRTGWNLLGYPQTESFDGMEIVKSLINRETLVKVQDDTGNSIENWKLFGGWQNFIGNFSPGKGYKIKLSGNDTLNVTENYLKSSAFAPAKESGTYFTTANKSNGVDQMNINLVRLPVQILKAGDEIAAFDGATCVGAIRILPEHLRENRISLIATASDNDGMAGFTEGNPFVLKWYNSRQNTEYVLEPEILDGSALFNRLESTFLTFEKYIATRAEEINVTDGITVNCFPNPFNERLAIDINLQNYARVEVLIYNQLGQKVKNLLNENMLNSGLHRLKWDGRNNANQRVTPGIYYVKIMFGQKMLVEKIVCGKNN